LSNTLSAAAAPPRFSAGRLHVGDRILAVEGAPAESTTTLERLLAGPPGSPCRVVALPRGAADDAVEAIREVQVRRAAFTPDMLERWRERCQRWDRL
jgi:C-terminal processing protease CtpA/Prc